MIAAFLVGPRDSVRLDTFRVTSGLVLLAYMAHWWLDDAVEWLTVGGFHLSPAAAGPGWLTPPPLPLWGLAPFGVAFFGVLLAFTIGLRLPWSAGLALLLLGYATEVDPLAAFTPNHLFLAVLAVFTVIPRGAYWTVDKRPAPPLSVWPVRLFQATLIVVYFTAGTCKVLHGDWLSDSHVLLSQVQGPYRTDLAAWLIRHLPPEAFTILQSLSLAFELLSPVLFAVPRLRPLGFWWGASMQAGIALTMNEIGYLSLQMMCFYVLFMDDATLHTWRRRFASLGRRSLGT